MSGNGTNNKEVHPLEDYLFDKPLPSALNYWEDLLQRVERNEPGAFVEWCQWMDEIELENN